MQNFRSSAAMVIDLHFFMKKIEMVKIYVYLHFIPRVIFSSTLLHAVTFLQFSTLMSLEDRLRESENFLMYGCNAGPPMAIPTVLCDIEPAVTGMVLCSSITVIATL